MTLSRIIADVVWFWQRRHNPMCALPEWREGNEIERRGHRTGCTQAVGRARKAKRQAVHAALGRKAVQ
ncbi:hypothetical protein ASD64_01490 [Mesorhizobium sp. Root157]|uniref:hypothetical protein n=1 Tax=Mesorhizobium sp. Root157 TaxID=1736477 RepID=UPI0006F54765|nr:hypothetical protein [Mesorhizobium sp. Root157]KRA00274.1 hypothetical protein ASD64_01490 [Mesorhizobium sp. Root157]